MIRLQLLEMMRDQDFLKRPTSDPFRIVERIKRIFEQSYDSNAHQMEDYTEHAFLCAMLKRDEKRMAMYCSENAFWWNVKRGYILDDGQRRKEAKFVIPDSLQPLRRWPQSVLEAIATVLRNKRRNY